LVENSGGRSPRITPEFLAHERIMLGDELFRQEYLCEFIAGPHTFLSPELIAAIDPSIEPLYIEPYPSIGYDPWPPEDPSPHPSSGPDSDFSSPRNTFTLK
jgi:hypothetical protein